MSSTHEKNTEIWRRAVVRCWYDEAFRDHLQQNPTEALKEMGAEIDPSMNIQVHVNTPDTLHLVVPTAEASVEQVSPDVHANGL